MRAVNQSWYEAGGVITQAMFLMLTNAAVTILQVIQPLSPIQRYCFAPFVVSQQKLNQMWEPPGMLLGELCALHTLSSHSAPPTRLPRPFLALPIS